MFIVITLPYVYILSMFIPTLLYSHTPTIYLCYSIRTIVLCRFELSFLYSQFLSE